MKNILILLILSLFFACSSNSSENKGSQGDLKNSDAGLPSTLNAEEEDAWEVLFDGTDTRQWISSNGEPFPENGWVIEEDALVLAEGGGDIITKEMYSDFDLRFEFNLTPEANSGIKYFVNKIENKENGAISRNGPEYQIIDDRNNPDVKDQMHETEKTASVYLLYAPENKKLLAPGEWNTGRIISKDGQVEHWLNGVKVLSYKRGSQDFRERRAATKFKNYETYGEVPSGHILLTDHHDKVYFKNIMIKRL